LQLKIDEPLSNFAVAFNFNLRRYTEDIVWMCAWSYDGVRLASVGRCRLTP